MSNWSSTQLTDLGRALDAKVTAGTTLLSFTKMKLGSGTETAEDIPAMTDLVSPKLVLGISSCAVSASDDTICELISVASSSDVEESFVVRELGVFATDPDAGEILYAVMLDSTPDTMPNENVSSPVTVTYQVNIVSANASSITAVIDPAGLVNVATMEAAIREHDRSEDAHFGLLHIRKNTTAYVVGDIAFSPSLPSYLVLKCTTAGTTAATEPSFSGATAGGTVTDGTVVWTYMNLLSIGHSIGEIFPYAGTSQPPGALLCNGAAVSRTMYPDLFDEIGTTYGAGDGSTTFNLPNLVAKFIEGDTTAGKKKAAGLPNITGTAFVSPNISGDALGIAGTAGALLSDASSTSVAKVSSSTYGTGVYRLNLDASNSSSIYGNSNTVQPPALTMKYYIQAFNASTDPALVDLTQIAQDLANKLTREQTPAFNKCDVVTTSGTYTAPVTGWYKITVKGGGGGGGGGLANANANYGGGGGGEGGTTIAYEKMTAGQAVTVVIGAGGSGGSGTDGADGGNSTVTVDGNTYTAGGGGKGYQAAVGGSGGTGTINGAAGGSGDRATNATPMGGTGGGEGGTTYGGASANKGGGGGGGYVGQANGGAGGNGYVWFEYFAEV